LIKPYAPAEAVCGHELREAHEVTAPDSEADMCPVCLSWSRRNKFQSSRCAIEMAATGELRGSENRNL
jgi:hypothetical protein